MFTRLTNHGRTLRPALTALAALTLLAPLAAGEPERVREEYLTRDQALADLFPKAARFESARVRFSKDEKARVEKRCGRRLFETGIEVFRALDPKDVLLGYATVTEEIGKYQPITFAVSIDPKAKVRGAAVMVYRESIGSEVRRQRFLSQFQGKTTKSSIRVNRDVIHISGATLSSRALARGVKKVLHAVDECVIGPRRRTEITWKKVRPEVAGGKNIGAVESASFAPPDIAPLRRARYLMGTVLELVCFSEGHDARHAVAAAFDEVARLEGLLSTWIPGSELSEVNRAALERPVRVSRDTLACIDAALSFARASKGAFDPTLVRDGHRDVVLDRGASTIRFRRELRLDLGGIGKGFAMDRAAAVLEECGVRSALLDFGGQILALEPPPGETSWIVPVRDPVDNQAVVGWFEVARASVSTSAMYERGRHIVDPRTGRAAEDIALSTSVVASSATAADALSTALFVSDGLLDGVDTVIVRPGGRIDISGAARELFVPLPALAQR